MKSILRFAVVAMVAALFHNPARAAELKENDIDFSGQKLALWEKRPAAPKAAILLLHGRTWSSVPDFDLHAPGENLSLMDAFVARGYAVYALDLPGYGKSPRLPGGWLSPNEASDALATALQWVAANSGVAGKPDLFGWSNGSAVAHLLAQQHPELISDLILFGYAGYPRRQGGGRGAAAAGAATPGAPATAARAAPRPEPTEPPRVQNTDKAARSDFRTPGTISQSAMDAYAAACLAADPVRSDWNHMEQWNDLDPAKIKAPVLLIEGQFDPNARLEAQAGAFSRFANPDREWIILANCDHAALIENTQPAFVAAIVNFLERPRVK